VSDVRHIVFISYHRTDVDEAREFVGTFAEERNVFIARALGEDMPQDIIDSDDPEYVMGRIRDLYLKNSTVTIVLVGKCTWSRKYVDWEIQSSLRHGETVTPNGLIGIALQSAGNKPIPHERLKFQSQGREQRRRLRPLALVSPAQGYAEKLDRGRLSSAH
jgi:hypothetical protein